MERMTEDSELQSFNFSGVQYDPQKQKANEEKHGQSFDEPSRIFFGPVLAKYYFENGEERWTAIGIFRGKYFTVAFAERGTQVRIISARKADATERRRYDQHLLRGLTET